MQFDDEDELKNFPNLMKAERYTTDDIEALPLNEVEKCLREYYIFSNTEPVDDYFDVESETTLRQHLFEAVVALLTHYEIGIKSNTTDDDIENMDNVFLYKELHKINLITNPDHKFHDTIAASIDFARMNVIKHRDDLIKNEQSNSASYKPQEEENGTQEVLCDEDIIHRIMGRATAMGIQVYPRDLKKLTNGELQDELTKIISKEKSQNYASVNEKSELGLTQEVLSDNNIIDRIMDYAANL